MTKKDYELIARVLNDTNKFQQDFIEVSARQVLDQVAANLATQLEAENPLFDRTKFLKACGLED